MIRSREFRGAGELAAFDWSRAARDRDIPLDAAQALYLRAMRLSLDALRAEALYLRWLDDAAAARRPAAAAAVPGRRNRVLDEAEDANGSQRAYELAPPCPGKWTRVLLETARDDARPPGLDDVRAAMQALTASAAAGPRESGGGALDGRGAAMSAELVARLAPHVGAAAAGAARLHTDAAADEVAGAHRARALTIGTDIFFARGEYAPGTARGDELLVHELTHVAQGQRGELARAAAKGIDGGGPLDPAEAEADLRARLALIELHPTDAAVPALAAPAGQPASTGDRAARLLAQQQRIALADQAVAPLVDPPAPAPAAAAAPVPNPDPVIAPLPAAARTGNAYVDTFAAPPSKQALELWTKAGTQATAQATADQARFAAGLPEMPVVLEGVEAPAAGGAGGGAPEAGAGGGDAAAPAGAVPASASTGQPAAPPTADEVAAQVAADLAAMFPAQPAAATAESQAQAQAAGQAALDSLPTTAPAVVTDPGAAPMTDLAGQADPVRTLGDHGDAMTAGAQALDGARTAIVAGPGAAQIQPTKLDEKLAVPAAQAAGPMPELPTVEGMTKLKQWNLPGNAQAAFDQAARPKMEGSLTQAKAQVTQAETTRDADRSKAVTDAQDKVVQAHAEADKQQQAKVAETRVRITNQQADALVKHEAEVKKLDVAAGGQKTATITKINDRITADQNKVDADFKDAQKRADDRKVQGEADAAKKKQDAQDQAASQSWWDQLVGAISDAIQSIAAEITRVLDEIATAIGQIIEEVKTAACQLIDAARDFVCQALTEFGDWLKSQVDALIGSVFPELAAALDALIDQAVSDAQAAVTQIADDLKAGVTALCDGLKAAVDGVIAAFKAAVQAAATFAHALLTGDWAAVARMVLDGILAALGIDPAAFYALVGQAQDSLEKIVADPGAFVNHLVDAVKLGFQQFGDNFWTHLQAGLVEWLTGTLSGAGITMPAALDLGGIFNLTCQVLGLTWPRLRLKVVDLIGEQNTERLEFVASYVEPLLTGGFAGLWEKIQQDLGNLWDMVVGGIRDWLVQNVVQQAVIKIATMWNPAGAIFQLIQTAWNAYQWLRQNAQRIFGLVQAVVNSISNIVAGDISGAANFVEDSLARLVPVAISLLADLLGLGGIAEQIKTIIGEVQEQVDRAIDALIQRVMALFRGGDEGGEGDEGDHEVPTSLEEPQRASLDGASDALLAELFAAEHGQVIYQAAEGDPATVTEHLLAEHSDASFDQASGRLTLPALDENALIAASSLAELGRLIAQQTGVSKVTVDVVNDEVSLRLHINPSEKGTQPEKKRGDHVFAMGLTKLPGELRPGLTASQLTRSHAAIEAALGSIDTRVAHKAFKLTVYKKTTAPGGDSQSTAFGDALRLFRPGFQQVLAAMSLLDLAVEVGDDPAEHVAEARTKLDSLTPLWENVIDAVYDPECSPLVPPGDKATEREGLNILAQLRSGFIDDLARAITAAGRGTPPTGDAP